MDLPDDVEILFMDDGSIPPLHTDNPPRNFTIHATNEFRPWTSSMARNTGAKLALGEYLFMTDGDYILSRESIMIAHEFRGDRLGCRREFGVLDENGCFTQDHKVLLEYGLAPQILKSKGTRMAPHPNNFVMRATLFQEMGGYDENLILSRPYPQREDTHFKRTLRRFEAEGRITLDNTHRPTIYMFPNGQFCGDVDYNPFGLFHDLTRKTPDNYWYLHPRYPKESV